MSQILERFDPAERPFYFEKFLGIFSTYDIDVSGCLPGIPENTCEIVSEMHRTDPWLDPNDTLILAQALADPDAKFFFTADSKLLGSKAIRAYERALREAGRRNTELKIVQWI